MPPRTLVADTGDDHDTYRRLLWAVRTGVDPVVAVDTDAIAARVAAAGRGPRPAAALARLRPRDREVLLLFAWAARPPALGVLTTLHRRDPADRPLTVGAGNLLGHPRPRGPLPLVGGGRGGGGAGR